MVVVVATGLHRPRSVVVDDRGQLLISGSQIAALVLDDEGRSCVVERSVVVDNGTVCCPTGYYGSTNSNNNQCRMLNTITGWHSRPTERLCT